MTANVISPQAALAPSPPLPMYRLDSAHSIWLFDTDRMRFRRLPKGADPAAPSLERDWQEYFALVEDDETGAFTVSLNEDRTRLLRSFREPSPGAERTAEYTLEPLDDR